MGISESEYSYQMDGSFNISSIKMHSFRSNIYCPLNGKNNNNKTPQKYSIGLPFDFLEIEVFRVRDLEIYCFRALSLRAQKTEEL